MRQEKEQLFHNKEYVYEVYKRKNFSKAAKELYISQPSLSAMIKKVEERIGEPIFDRRSRSGRLTACGEEYIRCVEEMMKLEERFLAFLNEQDRLLRGEVRIGGSNYFSSYIIPPIMMRFRDSHPNVRLSLTEQNTSRLETLLSSGELDFVIDNFQMSEKEFDSHVYFREKMYIAVPESLIDSLNLWEKIRSKGLSRQEVIDYKEKTGEDKYMALSDIGEMPFLILRRGNDTRRITDKVFSEQTYRPNVILELDQLATAYRLCECGMGATFVSDGLIRQIIPKFPVLYFEVGSESVYRDVRIFYKKGGYVTRAMQAFLEIAAGFANPKVKNQS